MRADSRLLVVLLTLAIVVSAGAPATAQLEPLALDTGASGLGLALRRVGVSGRVLYVTAHPDDEHNGLLVRLARGLGLRTALLTLTRGEGGQNAIGAELFDALGVLRTEELMAMHRMDGVEQYFGRPYEFGYSFSVEETFEKWGREQTEGDIVRVIRAFRPDVVLTLPLEAPGRGGQHHQAVAQLTRDAFRAAADPARFPDQASAGLEPWQARKLYQGGTGGFPVDLPGTPVEVATGVYDPLLGMTWQELGSLARSMHRCQDMGQLKADPGAARGVYSLVDAEPAIEAAEDDILDGVDTTLTGLARFAPGSALGSALAELQEKASVARDAFDPLALDAAVRPLADALEATRALLERLPVEVPDPAARGEIAARLKDEEQDIERALVLAQGLVVEARAEDGLVTPGQSFEVTVSVWNHRDAPVELEDVTVGGPAGWTIAAPQTVTGTIDGAGEERLTFTVTVPADARLSGPYWHRRSDLDRHALDVSDHETLPWAPPAVVARLRVRIGGALVTLTSSARFRYPGPFVGGEKQHVVQVVPEISVRVLPERAAVPLAGAGHPLEVRAFARHNAPGPGEATVRLEVPEGWSVEPLETRLHFAYEGEEVAARFEVTPPARPTAGTVVLQAVASRAGREYRDTVQEIAYDHTQRRQRLHAAQVQVLVLDVRVAPDASVGYVMGSGDAVADGIRQLGVPLTLLTADDLAFGDLTRFSTIVTGIRAYENRRDLRSLHHRLMQWVEEGGHLVVQYNRFAFNQVSPRRARARSRGEAESPFAPYPAAVTRQRITDETASFTILAPDHVLLTTPNHLGEADWSGWVQERGIYFLDARDPRYVELLAATDPFPNNPGEKKGILVDARVGKGTWTYVGLVLFREVPAGVPGGWRLLANLVSRPRGR
jgi:LmbE family N-acetylglucosaminyl deacetylase